MFPTWRFRLREARVAWQNGRYDDAGRLLAAESLREFLPAKELARDVASKIVERAGERLVRGESAAGWRDLETANRLGGRPDAIAQVRRRYAEQILDEAWRSLVAGDAEATLARIEKLQQHGLMDEPSRGCRQIAAFVRDASVSAARGHFAEATDALAKAKALVTEQSVQDSTSGKHTMDFARRLDAESERLTTRGTQCLQLSAEMHAALTEENWGAALSAAEALLAIAPQHVAAGQARRRAWQAVGMDVTQPYRRRTDRHVSLKWGVAAGRGGRRSTRSSKRSSEEDTVTGNEHPRRALLWIDAVGGFLVCLDDYLVLGQPSAGEAIALPILADLSRRHAAIRRNAGQYVLEPMQSVHVDGREISGPHVLCDNQVIQLGDNVRLRFTRPHALSATARLDIESHHKTQPSADAVLLMADSCVLGPNKHCHVRCRDWQRDVIVYRQQDKLYCRADEPISLDGIECDDAVEVDSGARVEGEAFSFTWEKL